MNKRIYKKTIPEICTECEKRFFVRQKNDKLRFCGRSCKNKFFSRTNPCSLPIGGGGENMMPHVIEGRRNRMLGSNNHNWIIDRSKLKKKEQRNDSAYQDWRKQVWLRDNFKCKIANPDCKGRIEAHHILSWKEYPELRYEVNNGITLCHLHHPRKRKEVSELSPYFNSLVNKEII